MVTTWDISSGRLHIHVMHTLNHIRSHRLLSSRLLRGRSPNQTLKLQLDLSQPQDPPGLGFKQLHAFLPLPLRCQYNQEQLLVTLPNSNSQLGFEMTKPQIGHLDHHAGFGSIPLLCKCTEAVITSLCIVTTVGWQCIRRRTEAVTTSLCLVDR